uniref:Uncharacterized protein n=1 Tax=Oryza sativa subsp. japonica TaxID=39947 RepID=Q6EPX5_ORYSJ|nr:hypothetical protein [Oryza sativa Japonica Group]BAD29295.1 hypothetical protein [Oryza sativa Japonica Group]
MDMGSSGLMVDDRMGRQSDSREPLEMEKMVGRGTCLRRKRAGNEGEGLVGLVNTIDTSFKRRQVPISVRWQSWLTQRAIAHDDDMNVRSRH